LPTPSMPSKEMNAPCTLYGSWERSWRR
jgi:hypothetical protein